MSNIKIEYPEKDKIYQHYKGRHYKVLFMVYEEASMDELIIYQDVLIGTKFSRPLEEWFQEVDSYTNMMNNKVSIKRFKLLK